MKKSNVPRSKSKGVYCIRNSINGDQYIGSTINTFYNRFRNHLSNLRGNKHHSEILQRAVDKYGIDNFSFNVLKTLTDDKEIIETEALLIEMLDPKYNVCKFVRHDGKPNYGRKLSKEWKEKIGIASSKYTHSNETLKVVTKNNKENACNVLFEKDGDTLEFDSWVNASKYFDTTSSNIITSYNRNKEYNGYKITKLSKQSNSVRLYLEDSIQEFNSMAECDRYLDLWRGATSTAINRGSLLHGHKVECI